MLILPPFSGVQSLPLSPLLLARLKVYLAQPTRTGMWRPPQPRTGVLRTRLVTGKSPPPQRGRPGSRPPLLTCSQQTTSMQQFAVFSDDLLINFQLRISYCSTQKQLVWLPTVGMYARSQLTNPWGTESMTTQTCWMLQQPL